MSPKAEPPPTHTTRRRLAFVLDVDAFVLDGNYFAKDFGARLVHLINHNAATGHTLAKPHPLHLEHDHSLFAVPLQWRHKLFPAFRTLPLTLSSDRHILWLKLKLDFNFTLQAF